jgi:hypothetical protein
MRLDCINVIKNNRKKKKIGKPNCENAKFLHGWNILTFNGKSISKAERAGLMRQLLRQLCLS